MAFYPFKKNLILLGLLVIFSTLFYFPIKNFPPVSSVHAQESGYCESDFVFNGGDAGDEGNWEYVGSCDDYYHENSDDSEYLCDKAGGDWDGDRCRTSSSSDNPRDESCPTERWDDSQTSGEYYCRDGQACYKKWKQLNSCDIVEDGWNCQNVDANHECSNNRDESCPITPQHPECRADGLVYQTFKDCNGEWVDAKPTGDRCDGGGGSADDNEEKSGACPSNQYWDINTGQCQNPTDEQAAINDEIYCQEECGGQCAGQLGAKYCVNQDGSNRYDCSDPANLGRAECRNELINEFAIIGLEPESAEPPVAATPSNPANPCEVDPGSEYCQTQKSQADQAQSFQQNCENGGDGEYYQECNWETHSVRAVCKVGGNFETRDLGQQPGLCKADPSAGNRVYCSNISCGEGFHCEVSSSNVAECKPNYDSAGESVVSSSSNQPKNQLITVLDAERNIRLEGHTLKYGPEGGAAKATSVCRELESDPSAQHNCLVDYYRNNPSEMEFTTPQVVQQDRDNTCRSQNGVNYYCDGNVCIEKSSGWDGSACVSVYKTVAQSSCNNSCSSDTPQSGQDIKLLSCLDETDPAKRAECNKENARIVQTGQRVDQSSLIKASLEIGDCSSLEGEAKKSCENKNEETRFLSRVLDYVQLENCSDKNGDEKSACDKRNTDAIKAGQVRLNLGIEDCSSLTGDKKTNCEFTNYQRDQITQAVISFKPEDCSIYQTEQEKTKCLENNQKGLSQAVSSSSPFVGLAEVGASCVYTEVCPEGGKKACAGKVASDNGAPVCKYDPAVASCSACTTGALDLTNKENKCSEDGQTCLNAPGYACVSDAQCQARLAAAQQAAANAPIDPAKFFSQKFEAGATCLQPQICDLGNGTEGEQVCYGKGDAAGKCDLSQGGGVCSACQAKGTIKLNREASCNAENKCVGAPALSGCMNDEQCKPVLVTPGRTIQQGGVAGPGQIIGKDQCVYNAVTSCKTIETRAADYYTTSFSGSPDARDLNRDKAVEQHQECFTDYIKASCPTYITEAPVYASQAITNHVQYNNAVTEASNLTNKLDQYGAAVVRDLGYIPIELEKIQADQQAALEKLREAEKALNIQPQASLALDRSTTESRVTSLERINRIIDLEKEVGLGLAQTAAARNQFNQDSIGNSADSEAVNQRYDEFEKTRQQTQEKINQLAAERGESGNGVSQIFQNQLDQLPTRADQQFKDQKTVSETNQLSNLARQSNSASVIEATQNALADRVEETERRGNIELARNLQRQAVQASFDGWLNVYASELSKPGADSEKGGTAKTQVQIQNLIEVAQISDPQAAKKMEQEYAALPNFVAALNLANEIKRETVGTFAGTLTQDNNSAFYSAIANAEEQAKSQTDLANLIDRTCNLSTQRCEVLKTNLGVSGSDTNPDQIAANIVSNSQTTGAKAANLLAEQSRLLPQLYQVERAGDTNNIEQLSSLLGRSNQIKAELAQIDPNLALRAQAQVQEVIAQGKAQNQLDYATNTYANNKELLLAFDKASRNDIGGLNGVDPAAEAEAARARMQSAIDQMRSVNPEKADAMQNDFDLTKFKLESFERGNAMVNSDGCVIEACQGNGSSAQNICTGQVAESKSFNRICAAKNGVVSPGEAAQLELAANLQSVAQPAKVANENQLTLNGLWQGAVALPSTIGSMFTDWRARATEGSIPVFTGTPEEQLACRDLWQNTRVQGAQQIQRGESSLGCTIDSRSSEEKALQAAQIANNGGTVKDIFSSLEGVKAESELRQRTLQRAAEEAGVSLDTPMAYWTPTQRDKFYEKLKGLDNAGSIDVFDAIIFPTAALSEVQSAMERCTKDWGKDLCQLDSNLASTYQGIAQADAPIYDQAIKNAKVLNPGIADVPQSDFAWVVDGISKQQRGGVIDLLTAGSVPTRDQFESDDAYYRAITADLAEKGGTGLTREQLINRLLLDANRQGITSADGSAMSREDIANAVDAYLAIGDFGRNVVNTSEAYQWQRAATTEFNWQLAQDVVGLATIAGPLEMLDPTNPIVELAIKGVTKSVSVPARAVTGVFDNVLERISTNTAKNVLEETAGYGLSRAESNAVAAFYDGRIAGKTVSQSIAELSPSQQLAFGQATDKIGTRLGLTETPDHLIAATVLDSILKPPAVSVDAIATRGRVIADLIQSESDTGNLTRARFDELASAKRILPSEVEALSAKGVFDPGFDLFGLADTQAEVLGRQVSQEVLTSQQAIPAVNVGSNAVDDLKTRAATTIAGEPEARVRLINGRADGIRVGQATEQENSLIAAILEPDPAVRSDANRLAEKWNKLYEEEKDDILEQVAREVAVNQAAARQLAERTPVTGNQALIQLADQSKAVSAGNTPPVLANALASASVVLPKVAEVVVKMADGTPLNALDRRALELAGISESSLQKNIDPLNQTVKLKVVSVLTADPAVLAKTDLETTLLNQGLTSNQASMLATSLQPLAPTPPAPAAQPGFMARLADTFNTLTGRNTPPAAQAAPNTGSTANNTAAQPNPAQPQQPAAPVQPINVITAPPLTPANPTIPNAPGWVNRATNQVANWLQVVDRPLNWLTSTINSAPVNTKLVAGPVLDKTTAASVITRLTNDLPTLESEVANLTQQRSDLLISRVLTEQDILGLEARRSNLVWRTGKRWMNFGDDLEIQLGLKKDELDQINQALQKNSDDLQTKNRLLTAARIELKQAEEVINPTSNTTQLNLRTAKERELAKRANDLAQANSELTYSPVNLWQERQTGAITPTSLEKLISSEQKLAALQAQMARDSENISVLTPEMQQKWLKAYNRVVELEGENTTAKSVLDQAREELRVAREGLAFRKVSEETYANALATRNQLKAELERLYFDANSAALDVNRLKTDVDYYRAKVVDNSTSGNELNDANRRLLNSLSPTNGFSQPTGFGFWKSPAKANVAFFMDTTGRLGIDDTGKQGIWVIARYRKGSDGAVSLDSVVVPHTAPQNLREVAKATTPGKWIPGKLSGDLQVLPEAEFNQALGAAQKVNTQQVPIVINPAPAAQPNPPAAANPVPPAAAPTTPVAPPAASTRITFDDLLEAPETLSPNERRYYDDLQFEKYFEDAHSVLFHSTDPADVAKIKGELGLPQNYSEADYFRQLEDLRNQRLQRAVELSPAEERGVRAVLGSYLPRDVVPVSNPPAAVVNSVPAGFRPTSQGEFSTSPSRNISEEEALRGIERVFSRKTSNIPSSSFDLEQVLGPAYTTGRNGIYYEVIGDGNSAPPIYRKMYLKFADQSEFAKFISEFKKTDPKGAIITLKQEPDYDEIVFYISYDPKNTNKADLDQIVGTVERLIDQANTGGVLKADITGYGLYSEDPVGVLVVNNNGNVVARSLATSQGTGTASNDAFASQVIYANLVDIARKYTSVPLDPVRAQAIILDLYQTNPAAAAEMADMYRRVMSVSGRDPLIPNTNRLITIAVNPSDQSAVDGAVSLAAAYKKNGYEVRVIDQSNVNTAGGNSLTRQQFDDGGFKISDQSAWNALEQKLQSVDTTPPAQAAPSTPVQQVAATVSNAVDNTADAIRAAGNGTPIQPVTDAAADFIEDEWKVVVDDLAEVLPDGSPAQQFVETLGNTSERSNNWVGVTQEEGERALLAARQEQTNLLIRIREGENDYYKRLNELNLDQSTIRQSILDDDPILKELSDELFFMREELGEVEARIRVIEDLGFSDNLLVREEQIISGSIYASDADVRLAERFRQQAKEKGPDYAAMGWGDDIAENRSCELASIPASSTIASVNSNVLGISTQGEVLAASTVECGPFAKAWIEMSKSQGGKILDTMTGGKLFDTYTDVFVKVDASLPEPAVNLGNQVIGLFKKLLDSGDNVTKVETVSVLDDIPVLKPLVDDLPKFTKRLSADEQVIGDYFEKIRSGELDDGYYWLYFSPSKQKIVVSGISSGDSIPFEINIRRNPDSSIEIRRIFFPNLTYADRDNIIQSLENFIDKPITQITEVKLQQLMAREATIPKMIKPDTLTTIGELVSSPSKISLYANRQIEQNWLNRSLETLLGDSYLPLKQLALPAQDPYSKAAKELDSVYFEFKSGNISQDQLIQSVESIAGVQTEAQKIQEIPLFMDERFLRTGLVAGRNIEDIKHWFGGGEWAGWLGARSMAQSYGDKPLSTSFIANLHQALLLPANTKEDVLIGDFRIKSIFGFKKDNPGEFPISKIAIINENPYLKFIETPVPEGRIARPDETRWGYIQYPRVGDADFMNSLPDHLRAKLPPRPTNQELVQVLVEDIVQWYNTENSKNGVDKIALAAELQRKLVSVHPFGDGNGRLSRVVMNWALENAGYPAPRIVNFNADVETSLEQWIETVRNGVEREQKLTEKLKLMEDIGWVDPVEALGYSELKTFYDLMGKNGYFANTSRLLPEVNGKIKSAPYGSLGDLNREIVLAWNNFHKMFGGESQVLADGTKITVGGLVPQSYIDLLRMKNPQNFEAYEKLIKQFYSNREIPVYRGIPISTPADTPQKVAALFEAPRSGLNSYYSNTFSSPQSPRFLRLEDPKMPSVDVYRESLVRGLENYNESIIDDYTDILDDETIQMEDKIDSLRRKVKIHSQGDSTKTEVSPFVSLSTSRGIAEGFAGGSYINPFFNQYSGKPNKRQATILVTAQLPSQGVVPTFNTGYQPFGFDGVPLGFDGVPPQVIPGIGGHLSIHTGEYEILVPGGISPAHIDRIQVKVRPNDFQDQSWRSFKFDAVKSVKEDGIYVEVKEIVIGTDGYPTGDVKQTTLFKLNPTTGKYVEVSGIKKIEMEVDKLLTPFVPDSNLEKILNTPMLQIDP